MNTKDTALVLAGLGLLGTLFYMKKAGALPGDKPPTTPGGTLPPVTPPNTPGGTTLPPVTPTTPGGSENARLARAVAENLKMVQAKYGPKNAKGKENKANVNAFQVKEGLGQDGKSGPGTMLRLARYEGNLPLVMYWPTGATKKNVYSYRAELLKLAEVSSEHRASELRASADRERGQAGIVGPLA